MHGSVSAALTPVQELGPAFVDRELELSALRAALDAARSGRGQLRLLIGEPGIGKTRTAAEVAGYARLQGVTAIWARGARDEGAPAYWPWMQILRACLAQVDPTALAEHLGLAASHVATIVPEIRNYLPRQSAAPLLQSEQSRFQLFEGVSNFLKHIATVRPLLLIIDDLHWADAPSLLLLEFVAREMAEAPLFIVATCCEDSAERVQPLAHTIAELRRHLHCERILLHGLDPEGVQVLLAALDARDLPKEWIRTIVRLTEGNPLFVEEVLRHLLQERVLIRNHGGWISRLRPDQVGTPQGVRGTINLRLKTLSAECRHVLAVAAVLGREFDLDVLRRIGEGHARADVEQVLREAVAAGVIAEVPRAVSRYRFAHALIQQSLYDEVSSRLRIEFHVRAGEALESLYGANLDPHVNELAYHFFGAARAGRELQKAVTYAERAAARAMELLAYEEAVHQYERALRLLEGPGAANECQRCELLLGLCEAQNRAGDIDRSKTTCRQAVELAARLGVRERLSRAALSYGSPFSWGDGGFTDEVQVQLLEDALAAWGDEDGALHVRLLARLAMALCFSAAAAERREALCQRATAMARRLGDLNALAWALNATHSATWTPDNIEERLAVAGELLRVAQRCGDRDMVLRARVWLIDDHLELGDIRAADVEIAACRRLVGELREPAHLWQLTLADVTRATLEGRFAEAEALIGRTAAMAQEWWARGVEQVIPLQMFGVRRLQGRPEETEPALKAAAALHPDVPAFTALLAYVYSEMGREAETRQELGRLAANGFADLPRDGNFVSALAFAAQASASLQDDHLAALLYDLLRPYEARCVTSVNATGYLGAVAHFLGILATTLSRWDDAARHFKQASAMHRNMGARPWVALTQYEYARMQLGRSATDPEGYSEAVVLDLLQQALATARELGMQKLAADVQTLLDSGLPRREAVPETDGERQQATGGPANVFRNEGDFWTIGFGGDVTRLRDTKGLQYIAHLLGHPRQEFAALDLASDAPLKPAAVGDGIHTPGAPNQGIPLLDAQAKAEYRRRLAELGEELQEAEDRNDLGRAERVRAEMDFIRDELASAVGLGGRDRAVGSDAERARVAVTKRIKAAIKKIQAVHPSLGRHLAHAVVTGYVCSYLPDADTIVSWLL